jgi:hypothetical protein
VQCAPRPLLLCGRYVPECRRRTGDHVTGVLRQWYKDCDPTADPLPEPLAKVDDLGVRACVDTSELGSLAFWCDGVPGVDLGKQKTPEGKWGEAWESGVARVDARVGRTGGAWRLVLGV